VKSTLRTRSARVLAVGAVAVTLVAVGAVGAFAAAPASTAQNTTVTAASITVQPSHTELKPGQSVTFTGHTEGLKAGDMLTLQRYVGSQWVTVKSLRVQGDTYAFSAVKLPNRGMEKFRVIHAKAMSPTVTINVR
jgi:hypothetical protein